MLPGNISEVLNESPFLLQLHFKCVKLRIQTGLQFSAGLEMRLHV